MTVTPSLKLPEGLFTALITPMTATHTIDWNALEALVERQLADGVQGFVVCGTTGEAATLSTDEREQLVKFVVKKTARRVPVIAGTGAQATDATIEAQKRAQACGADFGLVVTPFYNKPNQAGLIAHMRKIAQACNLPFLLYNVPSRTGVDLKPETVTVLAEEPHIIGIKDATGDVMRPLYWRTHIKKPFAILSGDDGTLCPFLWMGGTGVISVASHVLPKTFGRLLRAVDHAQPAAAQRAAASLVPWCHHLFTEPNPIPVKAVLALMGQCENHLRLPLVTMTPSQLAPLQKLLGGLEQLERET